MSEELLGESKRGVALEVIGCAFRITLQFPTHDEALLTMRQIEEKFRAGQPITITPTPA